MKSFIQYLTEIKSIKRDGTPENPYYEKTEWDHYMDPKVKEQTDKLSAHSLKHNLNTAHIGTLREYKRNSKYVNYSLRGGEKDHEYLKHLDHITSQKTEFPLVVHRGFGSSFKISNMRPGETFKDLGYTGTSITNRTAINNSEFKEESKKINKNENFYRDVIAKIHVPIGTKGHYLDVNIYDAPYKNETEFLLHRGTTFKVLHHTDDPKTKKRVVHMIVHHQEDHSND